MENYKKVVWGGVILAVVLTAPLVIYFFFLKGAPAPEAPPTAPVPSETQLPKLPEREAPEASESPEPPAAALDFGLDDSDGPLREQLRECTERPGLERWLKPGGLLRRFVAVTDNIAHGESPASHLEALFQPAPFPVVKRDGLLYMDPAGYERYRPLAALLASLDAEKLAVLYIKVKPLLDEAYKELGYPEGDFGTTMFRAFAMLLDTPVLREDILLAEKVTAFAFADPGLENLNAVQKHLLRMGPVNIGKIKTKINEIMTAVRNK